MGKEFDDNFVYEIAFGFMPRLFKNTPEDRYMLEEEGDVTEIYFIMNGEWAIAYNSYLNLRIIWLMKKKKKSCKLQTTCTNLAT